MSYSLRIFSPIVELLILTKMVSVSSSSRFSRFVGIFSFLFPLMARNTEWRISASATAE